MFLDALAKAERDKFKVLTNADLDALDAADVGSGHETASAA